MDRTLIEKLVEKHEGRRAVIYRDTKGILTVGIGFNIEAPDARHICQLFGIDYRALTNGMVTLTEQQIDSIFEYQLNKVLSQAKITLPNFDQMPDTVQAVVCDLIFNLGWGRFQNFHQTIASLKAGNWKCASSNLEASLWFHEVGLRGPEDVRMLREAA